MGRHHAREYAAARHADLVALCDLDHDLLDEYHAIYPGTQLYTDAHELFSSGTVDAVSIAVPNFLHAELSIAALPAGLHVLCEKPMALNAVQAERMLLAARQADRILMVHFNYRFSPPSRFAKQYVEAGHLGQVYYAKTRWLRARGIPKLGGWFGIKRLSGGGPMIDLGVHRLDLALWLMGYPKAVAVSASTFSALGAEIASSVDAEYDVEDLAVALIRLDNGVTLNLEVSWAGGTEKREDMLTAIYGTAGAVVQRNRGEGYDFEALALSDESGHLSRSAPKYSRPSAQRPSNTL